MDRIGTAVYKIRVQSDKKKSIKQHSEIIKYKILGG